MRTTLNLQDDILIATKNIARREGRPIGDVISDLVRTSLQAPNHAPPEHTPSALDAQLIASGIVPYYGAHGKPVTNQLINKLRDEAGV